MKYKRGTKAYEEKIASERFQIHFFVMGQLRKSSYEKVMINDVYKHYKAWRKHKNLKPSVLSLKSFGKVFPKNYKRENIRIGYDVGKGLKGYVLKEL